MCCCWKAPSPVAMQPPPRSAGRAECRPGRDRNAPERSLDPSPHFGDLGRLPLRIGALNSRSLLEPHSCEVREDPGRGLVLPQGWLRRTDPSLSNTRRDSGGLSDTSDPALWPRAIPFLRLGGPTRNSLGPIPTPYVPRPAGDQFLELFVLRIVLLEMRP